MLPYKLSLQRITTTGGQQGIAGGVPGAALGFQGVTSAGNNRQHKTLVVPVNAKIAGCGWM